MWIALAFGSAFFAGLTAVLAKIGVKNVDSNLATALRTIVVLVFSWLMVFIVGSEGQIYSISPRSLIFLILSGLATGASWLCYFRALQIGDVNKVRAIDRSSTVLTMALAFILLGESFSALKGAGMALIAVGTLLMIQKQGGGRVATGPWLLAAIGSAVFASLTSILAKIGIEGVESNLGTAIRTSVVLLMAWMVVFITGKQRTVRHISGRSWLFLLLSGLATGGSWLCYYKALQLGPASVVVPIDKLGIVVTVLFSRVALNEKLSGRALFGLMLLVTGTLLMIIKL